MTAKDYWLSLEEPWRTAVTLAWEAYVGGNVGVGAVLTDPRGRIVAVGRNRGSLGSLLNAAKGKSKFAFRTVLRTHERHFPGRWRVLSGLMCR